MNTASRFGLESDICEIQKKIANDAVVLGQKEISLKFALERLEEVKERYQRRCKMRLHARTKADVVDIKEYAANLHTIESVKDDIQEQVVKVATLQSSVNHYRYVIKISQERVAALRLQLAECGKVIPWKK